MSILAGLTRGPALGIGAVAVAAVGGALYFAGVFEPAQPLPDTASLKPAALVQQEPQEVDASKDEPSETPQAIDTPKDDQTTLVTVVTPSIDTFRLEPDGSMLVAGQADPRLETQIVLDGQNLQQVEVDPSGQFVSFLSVEDSEEPRVLSLLTLNAADNTVVTSTDVIIIAPSPSRVVATPDPEEKLEIAEPVEGTKLAEDNVPQPSQTVLLANEEGVQVLQPATPLDVAPEIMSNVALDAISYSEQGEVHLSGRAQGTGFVRVYLNNAPIVTSQIQSDGIWRTDLPEVDTGVYTLRIDETDAEGNVTSRVETPFKREDEDVVAQANAAVENQRITAITVQPGTTLWAISRERYGEGTLYVRVYEANRDRIRDPDLIYPGQVFSLPE